MKPSDMVYPPLALWYPPLLLDFLPSNSFSSSNLTHLYINVETFGDCLYLLDGRLKKLTTFCVNVYHMDRFSDAVYNMVSFYK
ncbi:unnamed protein product [Adineta steineri]|uniref:Uncharacterized protein n=1 Tax=Adineta steineri TaxID=433720 RepID=A0A816GYC5_9BILA|nr:unnamed protein product [Adineta steineri]CAF1679990.1 unnamed protein product [Adineta steineri]